MSKQETLRKVYYNQRSGFGSQKDTLAQAKKLNSTITAEDVREFFKSQELLQKKKARGDNSFVAFAPHQQVQIDLAEFGGESEFRYGLVGVDIFSKKLAVVPLTTKTSQSVADGLELLLKKLGVPASIYSDIGKEFQGKAFRDAVEKYDLDHILSRSGGPFVERANLTLKEGIGKRLTALELPRGKWWKVVESVVRKYNGTEQTTTEEKPNELAELRLYKDEDYKKIEEVRGTLQKKAHNRRKYPRIALGSTVRILRKPGKFSEYKQGVSRWSEDTYVVQGIERNSFGQPAYLLQGADKPMLRHELLLVPGTEKPPVMSRRPLGVRGKGPLRPTVNAEVPLERKRRKLWPVLVSPDSAPLVQARRGKLWPAGALSRGVASE